VAEDDEGGGRSGGSIDIPKLGKMPKKPVFLIAGGAAVFVLWRYWQARSTAAEGVAGDSDGDGFADGGILPVVQGQGGPVGDGSATREPANTDDFGFHGLTNSQWTQYAVTQLSASDRWSYTDIVEALGQYLANRPLTATQQSIVQAAIAAAGQPPEGNHVIVPGGNVPITVAPGGLRATVVDTTTVDLTWNTVAGASGYRVYRSGAPENIASSVDGKARVGGLQPNTKYTFYVAALSSSSSVGPKSAGVTATTKAVSLRAPTGLRVEKTTSTLVQLRWSPVAGASGYRLYTNESSENVGSSVDVRGQIGGLKKNHTYRVHVRAVDNKGTPGPSSASITVKTKK